MIIPAEGIVLIFGIVAVGLPALMLFTSYLIRMRGSPAVGETVYECGEVPFGSGRPQFNSRYYVFALIYVIFAVETIFIIPWAVSLRNVANQALFLGEMVLFISVLGFGLGYVWKKGALEWM